MSGMDKFLNFMKLSDDDDDDFDDEPYYEDEQPKSFFSRKEPEYDDEPADPVGSRFTSSAVEAAYQEPKRKVKPAAKPSKLVSINNSRGGMEVHVVTPEDFNEAQSVANDLKNGLTVVINMERLETYSAQRIIDFIGGACYAIDGTLQAISNRVFIAAPSNTEVTGSLREEILNGETLSPDMNKF